MTGSTGCLWENSCASCALVSLMKKRQKWLLSKRGSPNPTRTEMDIIVDMDQVTINGTVVKRPDRISRSDWLWFWGEARNRWTD